MASRATNLSLTSIGIAALILGGSVMWFGLGATDVPADFTPIPEDAPDVPVERITVHISGAVVHPGVVTADVNARVATIVGLAGGATSDAHLSHVNLAATVRDGDHIVIPSTNDSGSAPSQDRFDLNTATASDLETLPGVGPVLAARIVAFREDNGPFETIEDLLDVPGIGESKLAAIRSALEDR
jgi:competence protein ComEA